MSTATTAAHIRTNTRTRVRTAARTMIITGASSGIGRALAIEAARNGWRVVLIARRAERLEETVAHIRAHGGSATAIVADVCALDTPKRIVSETIHAFGRIDVVVNNAGHAMPGALLEQSDEAIEQQWQLHVAAPLRISRAALPYLRQVRGGLVFVGSGLARVPAPYYGAYCSVKAAVRAASSQLRRELRSEGVAVTYVDPGAVDTEFSQASGMPSERDSISVKPERVARTMLRGIERRARVVNAVPAHVLGAVFGEWLPWITDPMIARMVSKPTQTTAPAANRIAQTHAPAPPLVIPSNVSEAGPPQANRAESNGFQETLAPLARRMERVKLSPAFVRQLLQPNTTITLSDAAMRWAGMPNKNERAALQEVFDALTKAGYLENTGDETWLVRRAVD